MLYLSQMLGKPVFDNTGEKIGTISDLAISTGEVFPRVTSLAFKGPNKTPFMVSWRKFVDSFDADSGRITLNCAAHDIRFSYQQPNEVLLARDLLNRQIVDTQGLKVVRVNDLKLSESGTQLRLLGAEVGTRGLLRGLGLWVEKAVVAVAKAFKKEIPEQIIAWNYMDLLDRDLSDVHLSVSHKTLDELHPADVADILEQLDPQQRANVFKHLDKDQAFEAVVELEDEIQTEFIDDLPEARAAALLGKMDPDDAADIVRDLSYEKAETLLRLMGVEDARDIRRLLGYKEGTAGGMMTTQYVAVGKDDTVREVTEVLRNLDDDFPTVHYVYVLDDAKKLVGVVSLRTLLLAKDAKTMAEVMYDENVITVTPDETEDDVSAAIFRYDLPAIPVVDEADHMLGLVTTEDAWDAIEDDVTEKSKWSAPVIGVIVAAVVLSLVIGFLLGKVL